MMQFGKREIDRIPFGEYKGMPVVTLPTTYLLWALTNPGIRMDYPRLTRHMLAILASRLADNLEAVNAELSTPPITWGMSKGELLNYKRQQRLRKAARKQAARLDMKARLLGVEDLV